MQPSALTERARGLMVGIAAGNLLGVVQEDWSRTGDRRGVPGRRPGDRGCRRLPGRRRPGPGDHHRRGNRAGPARSGRSGAPVLRVSTISSRQGSHVLPAALDSGGPRARGGVTPARPDRRYRQRVGGHLTLAAMSIANAERAGSYLKADGSRRAATPPHPACIQCMHGKWSEGSQSMSTVKTSESDPIRIAAVTSGRDHGRIGVTLCPGKTDP